MREKTNVNDVDRSMYDFRNEEKDVYRVKEGLTPAIVEKISSEKHDPVCRISDLSHFRFTMR